MSGYRNSDIHSMPLSVPTPAIQSHSVLLNDLIVWVLFPSHELTLVIGLFFYALLFTVPAFRAFGIVPAFIGVHPKVTIDFLLFGLFPVFPVNTIASEVSLVAHHAIFGMTTPSLRVVIPAGVSRQVVVFASVGS